MKIRHSTRLVEHGAQQQWTTSPLAPLGRTRAFLGESLAKLSGREKSKIIENRTFDLRCRIIYKNFCKNNSL